MLCMQARHLGTNEGRDSLHGGVLTTGAKGQCPQPVMAGGLVAFDAPSNPVSFPTCLHARV